MLVTHLSQICLAISDFINRTHDALLGGILLSGERAKNDLGFAQLCQQLNLLQLEAGLHFVQPLLLLFREIIFLCITKQHPNSAHLQQRPAT